MGGIELCGVLLHCCIIAFVLAVLRICFHVCRVLTYICTYSICVHSYSTYMSILVVALDLVDGVCMHVCVDATEHYI